MIIEVIAHVPTEFFHCSRCEVVFHDAEVEGIEKSRIEAREASLPEEMMVEYRELCRWILNASRLYAGKVLFRVTDAASWAGMLKSYRYGLKKYPAMILGGRGVFIGDDLDKADALIREYLANQAAG